MKVHSILRKQRQSAQDVKMVSTLVIVLVVSIILFSFFIQNIFTQERNQGRNIRTEADFFNVEIFKSRTHVMLFYLNNTETPKEISTFALEERLLEQYHTYLQDNTIIKQAYMLFLQQNQTFSIIINFINLFQHRVISESLARLYVLYTSRYETMLEQFQALYTNLFVTNNNSTTVYNTFSTLAEFIILALFSYFSLFPSIRKFMKATKEAEEAQQELLQRKSGINAVIREKGKDAYQLHQDVACIYKDTYIVGHLGATYTVFFNEKNKTFVCECDMFITRKVCWHVNRASWLHGEIYK